MNLCDLSTESKCLAIAAAIGCMVFAGYLMMVYKGYQDRMEWKPVMGLYFAFGITLASIGANLLISLCAHHLLPRENLEGYQALRLP